MPKWIRGVAAACALVLAAAACSKSEAANPNPSGSGGAVVEGGVLRLGSSSSIDSLNPFKAFEQDAYNVFQYIYPFLVQWNADLELVGDWATDWTWSDDHTSVEFHLVTGGTWSDGKPLTASDAAYTLNLILRFPGPTGLMAGYARHITSAEATDDGTLTIQYEAPVNEDWALSQLQQIPILPEQVWSEQEGEDGKGIRQFTNAAPIVSGGPFTLTEYTKDEFVQMERNDGFYGTPALIEGWGLKFFTNPDAMVSALESGDLDAVESVPAAALDRLASNPQMVVAEAPGLYWDDFIINSNKPLHPELLDPKVREAFEHAIDRQSMVDTVLLGHGNPASTIVSEASGDWHNSDIQPLAFDLAQANQILDDAGYPMGPDGVRTADGEPMRYEILTPTGTVGVDREFEIIQSGFEQIGVEVTQKSLDPSALFDLQAGPEYAYPHSYDKFDLVIWDWFPLPDPDFILSVLTCEQWGFWSDTGYCNKAYDQLYEDQGLTVDPAERQDVVWQMQQMIFDDRPYIPLMNRDVLEAHSAGWDGFVMSPIGSFTSYSKLTLTQVHRVG
ncbi:MAG TPA: ABC transporter substrate-binding protein [Actinomycetota bacterium]